MILVTGNEVLELYINATNVMCVCERVRCEGLVDLLLVEDQLLADPFCALTTGTCLRVEEVYIKFKELLEILGILVLVYSRDGRLF